MTLTRCSDVSPADWLTARDQPWEQLVTLGPAGFPAYARLRFLPDPAFAEQRENDVDFDDDGPSETARLRAVLAALARHTRTPEDCYFCLWDGWGWGQPVHQSDDAWTREVPAAASAAVPAIAPSSSRSVRPESMVVVPHRAYFLFRGAASDLGDWGPDAPGAGRPEAFVPDPAFVWPADQAWCVANDVDPHWAGIGAATAAIDELIADPRLDVVPADPGAAQPRYR